MGEKALSLELGQTIDEDVNARVHLLAETVRRKLKRHIEEVVPTYRSLLVFFDPLHLSRSELVERLKPLVAALPSGDIAKTHGRIVRVPVCYGGELGPDLAFVAEHNHLTPDEVVAIHGSQAYRVYMLGFTPGFPYLGGMSERIAAPRLDAPRPRIPAGSVGIAGTQTGIYPVESPGGWRLIGRTPLRLFDPRTTPPFLLAAGDKVRFVAVSGARWKEIEREVAAGTWVAETEQPAEGGAS